MRAPAAACLVLWAASAHAEPLPSFTVGPGGTHASIQSAIDAALASGESREIRVAAGTWSERLTIRHAGPAGRLLLLSGGWDKSFLVPLPDVRPTVVDAGRLGAALVVETDSGHVAVQ